MMRRGAYWKIFQTEHPPSTEVVPSNSKKKTNTKVQSRSDHGKLHQLKLKVFVVLGLMQDNVELEEILGLPGDACSLRQVHRVRELSAVHFTGSI